MSRTNWRLTDLILVALLAISSNGITQVDTWTPKTDMPTARTCLATAIVNDKIYAIGGIGNTRRGRENVTTVEAYDYSTDTWETKADMPTPRGCSAAVLFDGKIYVFGGETNPIDSSTFVGPAVSTVEVYDPDTDTWTKKNDLPVARSTHAACVVNGKIYLIGGWTKAEVGGHLRRMDVYDPATDTWERKADLPTPRNGFAIVTEGKIRVMGGWRLETGLLSTVEVYEPDKDKWERQPDMPFTRNGFAVSTVRGKVYVVGGVPTTSTMYYSTDLYQFNFQMWHSHCRGDL